MASPLPVTGTLPESWQVRLPIFEGPLDLLLQLIRVQQGRDRRHPGGADLRPVPRVPAADGEARSRHRGRLHLHGLVPHPPQVEAVAAHAEDAGRRGDRRGSAPGSGRAAAGVPQAQGSGPDPGGGRQPAPRHVAAAADEIAHHRQGRAASSTSARCRSSICCDFQARCSTASSARIPEPLRLGRGLLRARPDRAPAGVPGRPSRSTSDRRSAHRCPAAREAIAAFLAVLEMARMQLLRMHQTERAVLLYRTTRELQAAELEAFTG